MTQELIERPWKNVTVHQRPSDGYFNASAMCAAYGKQWTQYCKNASTRRFFSAVEAKVGIPTLELIQVTRGGAAQDRTWVHKFIAMHLAQWLSAEFALAVNEWVAELVTGERAPSPMDSLDTATLARLLLDRATKDQEELARIRGSHQKMIEDLTEKNDRDAAWERLVQDFAPRFKKSTDHGYGVHAEFLKAARRIGQQGDLMSGPEAGKPRLKVVNRSEDGDFGF